VNIINAKDVQYLKATMLAQAKRFKMENGKLKIQ